jgi:hypothetical protein
MKTRGRRALACAGLFLALNVLGAATWLSACGDEPLIVNPLGDAGADGAGGSSTTTAMDGGDTCSIIDASTLDAATVANGLAIIKMHKCFDCHGDALSGNNDGVQYAGDEGGRPTSRRTPTPGSAAGRRTRLLQPSSTAPTTRASTSARPCPPSVTPAA